MVENLINFKRKVLLAIVESPGWSPPTGQEHVYEIVLAQLSAEGWIVPRMDGFEATALAVEKYPDFIGCGELANLHPQEHVEAAPQISESTYTLYILNQQRVEQGIDLAGVKGSIVLATTGTWYEREVEITVRVRPYDRRRT
jgi:hypothetical protein